MTLLCDPVTLRVVKRDYTASVDLTRLARWELQVLRSRFGTIEIEVDPCPTLGPFVPWCDLIEVHLGGELMMRYMLRSYGRGVVAGVGMLAQLNRRRFQADELLVGGAHHLWHGSMLAEADSVQPMLLPASIDDGIITGGSPITLEYSAGDLLLDMHDDLAGVHVIYAEHGGRLWSWAVEAPGPQPGPPIRPGWFAPDVDTLPTVDGDSFVNEVMVRYGERRDRSVTWPPGGAASAGGHRVQSPPLEFPEIRTSASAYLEAETAWNALRSPQRILDDLTAEPGVMDWDWLIPGREHLSHLPGTEGETFNLDQVVVGGFGSRVDRVSCRWDQVDTAALRQRVRAAT